MLDTILIVDATMIVSVLFAEAVGRAMGIKAAFAMARWMFIWGLVAILPFSVSGITAILGYEWSNWITIAGFIGFATWFLIISYSCTSKESSERQIIVSEEELAAKLAEGYTVVAVLESGRVVVE